MLEDLGIRQEYWIVGPNYVDAEKEFRVVYNDLKRLEVPFDRPGTYYDPRSGNMQLSLHEGRFLLMAKSAAHPDSLVGEGLHGVVMAEAAKMKASIWSKYVRPTLSDYKGWSLWSSTPEGRNHFFEMWEQGQDPEFTDWESFRSPSWFNSFLYPDGMNAMALEVLKRNEPGCVAAAKELGGDAEIIELFQELGPVMFGQEIECRFSQFAGLVYYDFDEEVHVRDLAYDPSRPLYIAVDYGFTNPNVALFIQTDIWDNVYVLGEYYRRERTEQEFADDISNDPRLGAYQRVATDLYPDPADPGASKVLSNAWKVSIRTNTGGELKNRINIIRKFLKINNAHLPWGHPDRQPRIFFDRSCVMTREEFGKYRYPQNATEMRENSEQPVKKDDHCMEALSRFFAGKYGTEVTGRPRVRRARVAR